MSTSTQNKENEKLMQTQDEPTDSKIEDKRCDPRWQDYEKKMIEGKEYLCCKKCSAKYSLGTSLTNLKYHYVANHANKRMNSQPNILESMSKTGSHVNKNLDKNYCNEILVRWICDSIQPLTIVEEPSFLKLVNYLNPNYKVYNISKIFSHIYSFYNEGSMH